jgi:hypothetical protein
MVTDKTQTDTDKAKLQGQKKKPWNIFDTHFCSMHFQQVQTNIIIQRNALKMSNAIWLVLA